MADVTLWTDKNAKAAFEASARARLTELQAELQGQTGIVAIEPSSGKHYVGATLGKANDAAYAHHPDEWVYFVRLDDPTAAVALPTW